MKIRIRNQETVLTLLVLLSTANTETPEQSKPWEEDFLLPEDTTPTHYNLYLFPNFEDGRFSGSVTIDIDVAQEKQYLWLHAVDLTITETSLVQTQCGSVTIDKSFFYKDYSFFVIVPKNPIPKGQYKLQFEFNGVLGTENNGLYIYTYVDSKNTTRKFIGNYFEPYQARQVFPNFDQPDKKATFTVQMVRPSQSYRALSNMKQVRETANSPSSGMTTVLFDTTPPMSTYVLTFFIVDYDHLPVKSTDSGIPVTMYAEDDYMKQLDYSHNLSVTAMNFYSKYFDVPYALPKLDLVALPDRDFAAFEGWGLTWFNRIDLIYEHGVSSTYQQYNLVETLEHELAHMWCGDSVTPTWWNDIFVSEGLAYYLQFAGINNQYPSWEIYSSLSYNTFSPAMNLDFYETEMPIVPNVRSINDGDVMDSDIMFYKSPSVLYMLENTIGSENFRHGISSFVKTYTLKNARPRDIWKQMEAFSGGINVTKFMASFTEKNGVPLVTVTQVGNTLTLTQSRFVVASNTTYKCSGKADIGCSWEIPITVVGSNNYATTTPYWFHMDQPTLTITIPTSLTWYKVNSRQVGYYMVKYSEDHWNRLADVLNHNHLQVDPADRANLIYDAFHLAKNGHIPLQTAFNMTKYMDHEDYYPAWTTFFTCVQGYDDQFADSSVHRFFRRYLIKKLAPQMKDSVFTFNPDSSYFLRNKNRELVLFACKVREEKCLRKTKQMFVRWLFNLGPAVFEDIRDLTFAAGMSQCGAHAWNTLWSRYMEEEDTDEKDFLFQALCYIQKPSIINKLLELAKEEEYVSVSRYTLLLKRLASNPVALPILWTYLLTNVQYVIKRAELSENALLAVLETTIVTFNTEQRLKELEDLLKTIPTDNLGMENRKLLLNSMIARINFLKENEDSLRKWFKDAATHQR